MPIDNDEEGRPIDSARQENDAQTTSNYTDEQLLKHDSVIATCGSEDVASDALKVLNSALETNRFSIHERNLADDVFMKTIKVVGIYAKLKGLLPKRTSVLPISDVDFSGNQLLCLTPSPMNGTLELSKRSLEPIQLAVQFVRTSTEARIISFEDCNLQGTTHDKEDKVEQELIRLVKKFGAGQARFAREVSFAGNKFEAEFAKRCVEAAFWERQRSGDQEKLLLDFRRNRIRNAERFLEELRAGKNAGGAISVAAADDPAEVRDKALIIVDVSDQVDRDVSPLRGAPSSRPIGRQPQQRAPSPGAAADRSASPRRGDSAARTRNASPGAGASPVKRSRSRSGKPAPPKSRPASRGRGGKGSSRGVDAGGRELCGDFRRGLCDRGDRCRYSHGDNPGGGGGDGGRGRGRSRSGGGAGGGGGQKRRRSGGGGGGRRQKPSESRSRSAGRGGGGGRRRRRGQGGGGMRKRRTRPRARTPSDYYEDYDYSPSPSPERKRRRGGGGGGGRKRQRR